MTIRENFPLDKFHTLEERCTMETDDKTIRFKSIPDNYIKEESGLKPHTERFTNDWTKERWDKYYYATLIKIENTETKKHFIRVIRDKTTYKNLAIISWLHPSSNSSSKKDCICLASSPSCIYRDKYKCNLIVKSV